MKFRYSLHNSNTRYTKEDRDARLEKWANSIEMSICSGGPDKCDNCGKNTLKKMGRLFRVVYIKLNIINVLKTQMIIKFLFNRPLYCRSAHNGFLPPCFAINVILFRYSI